MGPGFWQASGTEISLTSCVVTSSSDATGTISLREMGFESGYAQVAVAYGATPADLQVCIKPGVSGSTGPWDSDTVITTDTITGTTSGSRYKTYTISHPDAQIKLSNGAQATTGLSVFVTGWARR